MSSPAHIRTRASKLALFSADTEAEKNSRVAMDSPFRALHALDQRFDKLTSTLTNTLTDTLTKLIKSEIIKCEERIISEVNKNISETEAKLLNEISLSADSLKADFQQITERVTSLESQCSEISALREEIVVLKNSMKTTESKLQHYENSSVSCDLRINGVPYVRDENLNMVFENICKSLNMHTPDYKTIYRTKNSQSKLPDTPIMVKFFSSYDRNSLLRSVALFKKHTKNNILLSHIGFDSQRAIYINENLTAENFKILRAAKSLQKSKAIHTAFSLRGIVYIKVNHSDPPQRISSPDDLSQFFRDNGNNFAKCN